jgi:hypothetical protein
MHASMWVQAQYLMLLCSFREQLQQHVRVHAVEAVMACREIEQSLQDLTGKAYHPLLAASATNFPNSLLQISVPPLSFQIFGCISVHRLGCCFLKFYSVLPVSYL